MDERWEKDSLWIEEAKKTAELLEPPESLSPKAVTDRLKQEKRRPHRRFKGYRAAAAAALLFLLIGGGSLWMFRQFGGDGPFRKNFKGTEEIYDLSGKNENVKETAFGGYRAAASYDEIYEYLKDQEEIWYDEAAGYGLEGEKSAVSEETAAAPETGAAEAAEDAAAGESRDYWETNTQVAGVDESDLVKTDGKYLYVVHTDDSGTGTVHIIEAKDGAMKEVAKTGPVTGGIYRDYDSVLELYVDGNTMILLLDCYDDDGSSYTATAVYDITDRENPELKSVLSQDGAYHSSRKNGNYVYVFTKKYAYADDRKADRDYIPYVNGEAVACGHIYYPERADVNCSLVITSFDMTAPEAFKDTEAVYYGGDITYVSSRAIYVAEALWSRENNKSQTQLFKLTYENGEIEAASGKQFLGQLNDQFSLDEYKGYLRLVATVDDYRDGGRANALYVMDENLEIVGSIHNLAADESIYSARFMGDMGYFVTFKQMDPLFSVDLSDPENPKIMDELKITGFSSYLHVYNENLLLGIGKEVNPRTMAAEGIKLSMFDISDPYNVKEQDKLVLKEADYSAALDNHKAVLIDTEKNLFGFCVREDYVLDDGEWAPKYRYVVYSYEEGKGFAEKFSIDLNDRENEESWYWELSAVRGLYIGETLYLTNVGNTVRAYSLATGEALGQLDFK